ncbi:MotE family protein [Virgibacillus sp. W0181]|uniref:MotE family protein n=1 Tax=Virgibacillus sp. W0181 TaxID=3391581 RepID=UPI003F480F1F
MEKQSKSRKNKSNPIIWFIFVIVVPLIVAIVLTVIILSVAGVNVGDWIKTNGSKIPIVSTVIKTDEEKQLEQQSEQAAEMIDKQQSEIGELNDEIENLQATNDELQQKILKLEKSAQDNKSEEQAEPETVDSVKKTATSFRKMDKEKAALIFQSLDKSSAVAILKELSNDVRGEIMGEMEPSLAAELTELLMEQ